MLPEEGWENGGKIADSMLIPELASAYSKPLLSKT
jgi:hypothetical protein